VAGALPLSPGTDGAASDTWTALPTYASSLLADYTALIVNKSEGVITGGPFFLGTPLSGITDMTGPDQAQIIAFMESRAFLERSWAGLARHTNAFRPPLPRGVEFQRANMIDLWPQTLWFVKTQWTQSADFPIYQRAAVPEPATLVLFGMGAVIVAFERSRRCPS